MGQDPLLPPPWRIAEVTGSDMPLRGELNSVDLAHIFQMLILNQKDGTLEIEFEGVKRQLHFASSGITVPFDMDLLVSRAAKALIRTGQLSEEKRERARCNMEVVGKDLLATLVQMNVIPAELRLQALREQLEEEVYELFFLKDASFVFLDGEMPEGCGEVDAELALTPNGLIMEAARRIDEWEYISKLVASGGDIVEKRTGLDGLDPNENDGDAQAVYAAIDGVLTVDEVIEETEIARFVVFRKIALLLDAGILTSVGTDDLIDRARRCLGEGRVEAAAKLYERAIELGVEDVEVLAGAGQAHETLGDVSRAAVRYLGAGRRAEEAGDLDAALKLYRRIRSLLPTQVEARERLFALRKLATSYFDPGTYDPVKEGFELARILYELQRSEELTLVLSGLLDMAGDDSRPVEEISDLSAQLGQVGYAIDALIRAASLRGANRDFRGAFRCLKKAQSLDPSRGDLSDQLRKMGDSARHHRARRRSVVRGLGMAVGFLVLFVGYGRYSTAAMTTFSEFSLEDFLVERRFDEGREHYRSIQWSYPLTIPFLLSFEKLRELEVAERNSVEIERYRSQVEAEQSVGDLNQARIFKEAAVNARHTGNYAEALELLRRAEGLSGANDPFELEAAIESLEAYLGAARRLKSEAAFYRNAGRFEEAHQRLAELLEKYSSSPEALDVLMPVRITSQPERARILVEGEPVRVGGDRFHVDAETPFVLDLPHGSEVELTLGLDGYAPLTRRVRGEDQTSLELHLARRPDRITAVSDQVMFDLTGQGDQVFACLGAGRIVALDATTLETNWVRELPDLAEATAAPAVANGLLLVPVSMRAIELLDLLDGSQRGTVSLPGRPASAPATDGDGFAVLLDGGGIAVGELPNGFVEHLQPESPVSVGPVALGGSRYAVGCEDGTLWIGSTDGSLEAVDGFDGSAGSIHSVAAAGDRLVVAAAGGRLHLLRLPDCEQVTTWGDESGQPAALLTAVGQFLVAVQPDRMFVFDLEDLSVRASLDQTFSLAACSERQVAVMGEDDAVLLFSLPDLALRGRFARTGPDLPRGVIVADRTVLPGPGEIIGIFPPSR